MTFIITQSCCNDASCVPVCPVNCIHPRPDDPAFATADMLYIDPATCIECGACVDECPVEAIKPDYELSDAEKWYVDANAGFFEDFSYDADDLPHEPVSHSSGDFSGLRVAVVGSGPAAFYTAAHILAARGTEVEMYERLDKPFGLIRHGVAPDHVRTRQVVSGFENTMRNSRFRLHLGVEIGGRLTHEDLLRHYSAVVYAVGAQGDRALDVPGEELPGSHAATEFVAWYNGHPDYADRTFDLGCERVVVVGNGNVALDVARVLAADPEDLAETEIAEHSLAALRESKVEEIVVVGRRGPRQAAYTPSEFHSLMELPGVDVVVDPDDAAAVAALAVAKDTADTDSWSVRLKADLYANVAARTPDPSARKRIVLRYLASPVEVVGNDTATGVRMVRNKLVGGQDGALRAEPCEELGVMEAGLILRSVGYRGNALPGLPFDDARGVIPNHGGRVTEGTAGEVVERTYVAGWIKRGPRGFIGSNKTCAGETVFHLLQDFQDGKLPPRPDRTSPVEMLGA